MREHNETLEARMDEMMDAAVKHAKKEHGYTDEQLNDPETQKEIKAAIKEE